MSESGERAREGEGAFVAAERAQRLAKLEALRERGVDPYPVRFDRDAEIAELHERFGSLGAGEDSGESVRVAGRAMLLRRHGGLSFATLRDGTGAVQLFVSRKEVGEPLYADFGDLDLGDWVGAEGTAMRTRAGELSVRVRGFELLAKALRPLPDKAGGLADVETRLRRRYLDLIASEEPRRVFAIRSAAIAAVRRVLSERGFAEVETPVLDTSAGGAAARPFVTHHNALGIDLYMRIAIELPLKRLVVGGMERVFEIGRVFRNEGLDTRHNPEFTLLEAYQAFADYHEMMELVETLVSEAARAALGTTEVEAGGRTVDLAPPWRRVTMAELIAEHAGAEMHPSMPAGEAREVAERVGVEVDPSWGAGKLIDEVYEAACERKLVEPTFVLDPPLELSPLARAHRDDPALAERFEGVVGGRELANAYSELNDPVDQRARFEAEARARAAGDERAEELDEEFVLALEYGLPPTGGLGIGLDRLTMLLAGVDSIREAILFPTMRPRGSDAD